MTYWVKVPELLRFMTDCLKAAGANSNAAQEHACLLYEADRCGMASHGLNRLENYVNDIKNGVCQPNNTPKILNETPSTAWVDACNVLGSTSAHYATDLAMKKAKETGVGWVSLKGCNHYGIGGYWAAKIARNGLIGMAFTNGSPLLAPTRSKKAALGTNPMSISAPGSKKSGDFYLDLATTAVSLGKIEMMKRRGQPLPHGWALGPDGKETVSAERALQARSLMPLGGLEQMGGYKGFGLSAMVDLFTGILAGASYGHHVRSWGGAAKPAPANLGHTFVAVNQEVFAPGFMDRVSDVLTYWRSMEPADPKFPVIAPGDIEKRISEATDAKGAIQYIKQQIDSSAALAKKMNVKPLQTEKA